MYKKHNPKQKIALTHLADRTKMFHLHYGGSRSGKTLFDIRATILRACKHPNTRHLICRASKASCVESVYMVALLPMLQQDFPGLWTEDKTHKIIHFVNGSSIWAGGFDNSQHTDALLSKEWATILVVEGSELRYFLFNQLRTRLNWDPNISDVPLKMIVECNPPKKSHWIFRWFFQYQDYVTKQPLDEEEVGGIGKLHFHPLDNKENLSPQYLAQLSKLQGADRARFWDGDFYDDTVGQIYQFTRAVNVVEDPLHYSRGAEPWRAWDFGIDPSATFIIFLQILPVHPSSEFPLGIRINILDEIMEKNQPAEHYASEIRKRSLPWEDFEDAGDPAGNQRNERLESWISTLRKEKIRMQVPRGFSGTDDYISHANKYVHAVRVNERQCPNTVAFFENWSRPKDKDGRVIEGAKPEHNEFSHGGTAFYYFTGVRFPVNSGFFEQQ